MSEHILIIEDDLDIANIERDYLMVAGYDVTIMTNGTDGIEAARQIGFHHEAPVVLLTSYSQQDLVTKARESGVYGYLIKPVREEQLIPTLEMACGRFLDDLECAIIISFLIFNIFFQIMSPPYYFYKKSI